MSGDADNDVVAIFHASFHPTKGNVVDWALTADDSLALDGVEFSVLPSGLHLVERDTVYFSHGPYTGLAVFRRRPTRASTHRGFRLSSLAILLQAAPHPRPWLHAAPLRALADAIYAGADAREARDHGEGGNAAQADLLGLGTPSASGSWTGRADRAAGDLTEEDFAPAREWFECRRADKLASTQSWSGWSDELFGTHSARSMPTLHLPHLLRILGLSSLTLYKCVLARRRVLIYTLPPVEIAGVLAWVAADLCREHQMAPHASTLGIPIGNRFGAASAYGGDADEDEATPEGPAVLGMVTLSDLARLERESATGRGWIACTTDAIFLERPQYYDLVIDLTTSTPSRASHPTLLMTRPMPASTHGKRRAGWKLETVRFTWSDIKLWNELDRILKLDSSQTARHSHNHSHNDDQYGFCLPKASASEGAWADAFRLYEDVCLLCATLWMGLGTWRSNSRQSFRGADADEWGAARAPGDDDWSLAGTHMRALGRGIEGGYANGSQRRRERARVRSRGRGIEGRPQGRRRVVSTPPRRQPSASSAAKEAAVCIECAEAGDDEDEEDDAGEDERLRGEERDSEGDDEGSEDGEEGWERVNAAALRRQNAQTTLALLQTFHANTVFWLSKLREIMPPPSTVSSSTSTHTSTPPRAAASGARAAVSSASSRPASPSRHHDGAGANGERYRDEADAGAEEEGVDAEERETITITARDMLALELGVLSDLDARFVEWLAEAEGYACAGASSSGPSPYRSSKAGSGTRSRTHARRRRVVVKRGWSELFGIVFGFK